MYNKGLIIVLAFIFCSNIGFGQNCNLNVQGTVIDEASGEPLAYVNVILQEVNIGSTTNDNGEFHLKNVCHGDYNLIVSHIGCEPKEMHIHIHEDTTLTITLSHNAIPLEGVVVEGKAMNSANQPSQTLGKQKIEDNSDENLSGLLINEAGVHIIKNGSGISKPVVHGLYGNRLMILNNGVQQSGQQWGNDHSPEIDPLIANKITVIKGTNALEYGGGNLGSIILVEPKKIGRDPHLHGRINYAYESNGRGNNLNIQLQKYTPTIAWRINGTLKKVGDRTSPDYFLTNTGAQEANLAVQLEKSWNDKLFVDLYASGFNTELGILRGSHIGNLTDLKQALTQEQPFFTEPNFRDTIEAPKQVVSHNLLKLNAKYFFEEDEFVHFILAAQQNNRKEFDVRRNGRSIIPALSLNQYTFSTDFKYHKTVANKWNLKIGNLNIFTDNTNNPETGILPLIPDYVSIKSGVFGTLQKTWNKTTFNTGLRYDFEWQDVPTVTKSVPVKIVRYENNYHNISAMFGFTYMPSDNYTISLSSGYTTRNPGINELYSNGLHQGVSGIEEGQPDLKTESALKTTIENTIRFGSNFSWSTLLYYQRFQDYIYLQPQEEVRLTIRGAFPVFKYEQTDAEIYGLDLSLQFSAGKSIFGQFKYSYIKGNDLTQDIPLVYIPPGNLFGSLTFRSPKSFEIASARVEGLELEINNRYVFEQGDILPNQDFVLPPNAYNLFGVKASVNIIRSSYKFRVFVKMENTFNTTYRDYLNRQRYFADDLGRSITFGANFNF